MCLQCGGDKVHFFIVEKHRNERVRVCEREREREEKRFYCFHALAGEMSFVFSGSTNKTINTTTTAAA